MATRKAKQKQSTKRPATDAISLLKADHRQVEQWFEAFEKTKSDAKKQDLAAQICKALTVHTTIEEEIFYPAFLEATEDENTHHEAEIEHAGAKNLIAQIEKSGPDDDYFDAKVKVLSAPADTLDELTKNDGSDYRNRTFDYYKAPHYWS